MIDREAKNTLLRLAEQFSVVGITGPRQSGKSILAKHTFPDKPYKTFDDEETMNLAKNNPKDFILALKDGAVIDEAQRVPEIFLAVKQNIDNSSFTPGKFILTGSSQFRLNENIRESLAGRIGLVNLCPLSISELKNANVLYGSLHEQLLAGFYTPFYDDEKHFIRDDWFKNYIASYIDMDVKALINASNINTFKNFIASCAHYSGQVINVEKITKKLGISAVTGKQWLSILEASYIVKLIYPKFSNKLKSIVKKPKLYFYDTGLLCYLLRIKNEQDLLLSNYKGAIIETAAMAELLKSRLNKGLEEDLSFLRLNDSYEVDAIANWDYDYAIEVKSASASNTDAEEHLEIVDEVLGYDSKKMIFYTGDIKTESDHISYIPWENWGDFS